jgi:hypothetical protein
MPVILLYLCQSLKEGMVEFFPFCQFVDGFPQGFITIFLVDGFCYIVISLFHCYFKFFAMIQK